jgi:hypothetical protein
VSRNCISAPHVYDEIIEPNDTPRSHTRKSLATPARAAAVFALAITGFMSAGAINCAFLMLTGRTAGSDSFDQVRLASEKSWRLQNIDHCGNGGDPARCCVPR